MKRTLRQNASLHLMFKQLADALNEAGLDVRTTLSEELEHPWTPYLIKELIWRRVQKSMYGKKSTTQLETGEIDKIFEVIIRYLGETKGFECPPFPSIESLTNDEK